MNEILNFARAGHEVLPMMFQPVMGRSNTVAAAIRAALKAGLLVPAGVDGCGKPKYRAPEPKATHAGTAAIN
jgi:hypothetical protein